MLKEKLLAELERNRDILLSGQDLADRFGVSRNAIWKAIHALQEEGHEIESLRQKGYRLKNDSDVLSKEGMLQHLRTVMEERPLPQVLVLGSVDSTNNEAKRRIVAEEERPKTDFIVAAREQTEGRGRRGRSFYSPADAGLYLTIVLRRDFGMDQALLVTTAAAVSVLRVIRRLTGKELRIKWVNDLFYQGKKVCGILTEAITDFESGNVSEIILGIGINWGKMTFPEELASIAGSLEENAVTKNQLAAQIYGELIETCQHLDSTQWLEEYRRASMVLGKKIYVESEGERRLATAVDIGEDGSLLCTDEQGTGFSVRSGTIRLA